MGDYKLNPIQTDILAETANVCAGKISTIISDAIGEGVFVKVSEAHVSTKKGIRKLVEKRNATIFALKIYAEGIFTTFKGDIKGNMLMLFPQEDLISFIDLIKKQPLGSTRSIEIVEKDYLAKWGEKIFSAYLTQMGDFLGLKLKGGDSKMASSYGMPYASLTLSGIDLEAELFILLRTEFSTLKKIKYSVNVLIPLKSPNDFFKIIADKLGKVLGIDD
jgi:chemotaxis protein CheY-P-specific phosphatase CheC